MIETKLEREIGTQTNEVECHCLPSTDLINSARGVKFTPMWKPTEFENEQINDPDIGPVYKFLKECPAKPKWSEISMLSSETKTLINDWERLTFQDGLLCRKWESKDSHKHWLQIIVPTKYRDQILQQLHDSATGIHLGFWRTYNKIQVRFYWPKLREYINSGFKPANHVK